MATKTPIKKRGKKSIQLPIAEHEQPQPEITFKNTKEKGDAYEIFIKHHLIDSGNYEWVYLWKHVPEAELFESGIMDDWNQSRIVRKAGRSEGLIGDIGTDLLIKAKDGKYSLVQCKHYNDKRALLIEDLGTFYFMMFNYGDYVNGIVFYTCKLSKPLIKHSNTNRLVKYNYEPFNTTRYIELMNTIYKPTENINDSSNTKLIPHDYQLEAIDKLRGKQRTVCQLPCGMGKTLIAIKLSEEYNQVIVITPLKIYCEQNMERFKSQMPSEYSMMIIDSDNDGRNIDKIKTFISNNEKICLFATFKSVDIVNKLISDKVVNNYYVIIDEFHNLSSNDILEDYLEDNLEEELLDEVNQDNEPELEDSEEDTEYDDTEDTEDLDDSDMEEVEEPENNQSEMYKLLHSDSRILFMSATPKLMGSDNDYSEDCDIDEEIFGNIEYKMDMRTAIERGGICDYMVYVPTLSIEKSTGLDKIHEEVDISKYDKELVIKARFIIRGMMNNGSRKCIVYLQTQEECRLMNTILADVGTNYFAIDVNSNYIISDSSREERKAIIKSFTDGEGYNFLCNVNILNECIDVPECDSIFIAYPSKSKIRNIQRMCRANRKNKAMTDKIARIYIWADEYKDELVDFIGHLKEYDSQFTFDKVKRLNVIGNKTAVMKSNDAVEENKKLEDIIVGVRGIDSWVEKLEEVKKFIDEHGRRPTMKHNKYLCGWLSNQIVNSKKRLKIMKNDEIYNIWNEFINDSRYSKYFLSNNEDWKNRLEELKYFIDTNNARPTDKTNKELNKWLSHQIKNSNKRMYIMKNDEIYNLWTEFISDPRYKKYFDLDNIRDWKNRLDEVKQFIDTNNARPTPKSNKELYSWLSHQITNSKNRQHNMKNDEIYNSWNEFITDSKYKKYFE
jgi:superfamily II DNA or RNA helicase